MNNIYQIKDKKSLDHFIKTNSQIPIIILFSEFKKLDQQTRIVFIKTSEKYIGIMFVIIDINNFKDEDDFYLGDNTIPSMHCYFGRRHITSIIKITPDSVMKMISAIEENLSHKNNSIEKPSGEHKDETNDKQKEPSKEKEIGVNLTSSQQPMTNIIDNPMNKIAEQVNDQLILKGTPRKEEQIKQMKKLEAKYMTLIIDKLKEIHQINQEDEKPKPKEKSKRR